MGGCSRRTICTKAGWIISIGIPSWSPERLQPTSRKNPGQHAIALEKIMMERGRDMQADQRQHPISRQEAVHVAGPAPAGGARRQQLRQFQSKHYDRHVAPGSAEPT